jgi:hypothetical protein
LARVPDDAFALAAPFAGLYTAYALGTPTGLADGVSDWLLSAFVAATDPNTLTLAFVSGDVWAVPLKRDACHHIVGYAGPATLGLQLPDLRSLTAGPNGTLFALYAPSNSNWFRIDELPTGASAPARSVDLRTIGLDTSQSVNNLAHLLFVPPSQDPSGLIVLTGSWWHLTYTANGGAFDLSAATSRPIATTGHAAYVPHGSPGFARDSLFLADEWNGSVGFWEVDPAGAPPAKTASSAPQPMPFVSMPGTSRVNIHFEPQAGDLFVGFQQAGGFALYVVQGFVPPTIF